MLQPPTILFGILTDLLFWFSFHLSIFLAHSSICLLPLFFNFPFFSSLPHSESSPLFHPPKKLIKNKFSIFLHIRFSLVPTPKFSKLFFFLHILRIDLRNSKMFILYSLIIVYVPP